MGDTLLTFENQFAHAWKFFWKSLINLKLVQLFSGHWVVKKNQNFLKHSMVFIKHCTVFCS